MTPSRISSFVRTYPYSVMTPTPSSSASRRIESPSRPSRSITRRAPSRTISRERRRCRPPRAERSAGLLTDSNAALISSPVGGGHSSRAQDPSHLLIAAEGQHIVRSVPYGAYGFSHAAGGQLSGHPQGRLVPSSERQPLLERERVVLVHGSGGAGQRALV